MRALGGFGAANKLFLVNMGVSSNWAFRGYIAFRVQGSGLYRTIDGLGSRDFPKYVFGGPQ